jgi:hypothetical protein
MLCDSLIYCSIILFNGTQNRDEKVFELQKSNKIINKSVII